MVETGAFYHWPSPALFRGLKATKLRRTCNGWGSPFGSLEPSKPGQTKVRGSPSQKSLPISAFFIAMALGGPFEYWVLIVTHEPRSIDLSTLATPINGCSVCPIRMCVQVVRLCVLTHLDGFRSRVRLSAGVQGSEQLLRCSALPALQGPRSVENKTLRSGLGSYFASVPV